MSDHFIQTFTGRKVNPLRMSPDDIDIRDIAHSLALINRFTGHTPEPYSVAQHSVLVETLCPKEYALWGLLHDAPEAYIADISRPVKLALEEAVGPFLKRVDRLIMEAVCEKFGLQKHEPVEVKRADDNALANEAFSFFGKTPAYQDWHHRFENGYRQLSFLVHPISWRDAEKNFLSDFRFLGGKA
jgi:hypothetical protein